VLAKLGKPEVIMEIGDLFISPVDGNIVRPTGTLTG